MAALSTKSDNQSISYRSLNVEEIIPKDDAYHGNINLIDIEWWYFDAVFENGYSIHIGFRTYHLKKSGFIQSFINVYKNGEVIAEEMKINLFSNFYPSSKKPTVKIKNKTVFKFDQDHYKKTNEWRYHVLLKIGKQNVDLTFTGTTLGWKIETSDTCWTVPLPKAIVTGSIVVNGKSIEVNGIGYHDHNWGYSPFMALSYLGWYWGRLAGEKLTITWAKTMINTQKGDLLAIINLDKDVCKNNGKFFSIKPENIKFTTNNYKIFQNKWIPTEFDINLKKTISNYNNTVDVNIHMETSNIQPQKIITANYWRYHVKSSGNISMGNISEILNNKSQIIEFFSFKSQKKRTNQ